MGAFAQAPMRSRHPTARVRNGTTQQAGKSNERQQNRVRLTESQTHRVVPGTSSLAYERRFGTAMWFLQDLLEKSRRVGQTAVAPGWQHHHPMRGLMSHMMTTKDGFIAVCIWWARGATVSCIWVIVNPLMGKEG